MILCDLCGEGKRCRPREIEDKEYDICSDCWNPIAKKLKGKGREKKDVEMITLPQQVTIPAPPEVQPLPGAPPKIWGGATKPH
ncbi:MAG: hypothetical protein ABSG13_23350 [Bryobacteraceae bacterium]|jgi:hypothetical protein